MAVDRMSPLDALFLARRGRRQPHAHRLGADAATAQPRATTTSCRCSTVRLSRVPRYRQVVQFVPFQLGRPVWVDDPHFNIEYHVRHTALPAPGGEPGAQAPRRPGHEPAAGSQQTSLGALDGRGTRRQPLGPARQDPSQHRGRRLRHRAAHRAARHVPQPGAARRRRVATRTRAVTAHARRGCDRDDGPQPLRAAPRAARRESRSPPGRGAARRDRQGDGGAGRARPPNPGIEPQRADRAAPPVRVGLDDGRRHQADPQGARRHIQRRGPHRDHRGVPGPLGITG